MTLLRRVAGLAALCLLPACATVPKAAPERDAAAKQFAAPPKGKAALYVFRDESMGGAVKMRLTIDGEPLGETGPKTFHWVSVAPGKHTVVGKAENESTVDFTARAGESVFVWQEVKMGLLGARNSLQLVDPERGHAGVAECELAEAAAK